jgi:hypothetical protein
MQPFLVSLAFETPIILTSSPTLDAVLAGELAANHPGVDVRGMIPLKTTSGIFHGSQLYLDGVDVRRAVVRTTNRVLEYRRMPIHQLVPNPGARGFTVSESRHRNILNRYEAMPVRMGYFAGFGDVDAIGRALADLFAVGKRRADGYGAVKNVAVEPYPDADERWGLMTAGGVPMRPVPLTLWRTLGGGDALIQSVRCRPYYWDQANPAEVCAVPDGNRVGDLFNGDGGVDAL